MMAAEAPGGAAPQHPLLQRVADLEARMRSFREGVEGLAKAKPATRSGSTGGSRRVPVREAPQESPPRQAARSPVRGRTLQPHGSPRRAGSPIPALIPSTMPSPRRPYVVDRLYPTPPRRSGSAGSGHTRRRPGSASSRSPPASRNNSTGSSARRARPALPQGREPPAPSQPPISIVRYETCLQELGVNDGYELQEEREDAFTGVPAAPTCAGGVSDDEGVEPCLLGTTARSGDDDPLDLTQTSSLGASELRAVEHKERYRSATRTSSNLLDTVTSSDLCLAHMSKSQMRVVTPAAEDITIPFQMRTLTRKMSATINGRKVMRAADHGWWARPERTKEHQAMSAVPLEDSIRAGKHCSNVVRTPFQFEPGTPSPRSASASPRGAALPQSPSKSSPLAARKARVRYQQG
eukprot:TRINITY_DN18585_c0_g1_i1.p1 TRINITY_DN18585_c0_g1~~TRINITY_DN18585_c0_g1_i1.p1  ORF type:complete len:408 (+),score=35.29 TRINITY_DN18585_c0_g1_i1:64-1287(+)